MQGTTFATLSGHLVTKTAREKIGRHFVLAAKEKTMVFASINLFDQFGHLGQHLTRQGSTFETFSCHLVTKTAREKNGRHFVLAYKEKAMGFQGINLFGHLGPSWATSYHARDHI